jgi:hypothetical protein
MSYRRMIMRALSLSAVWAGCALDVSKEDRQEALTT